MDKQQIRRSAVGPEPTGATRVNRTPELSEAQRLSDATSKVASPAKPDKRKRYNLAIPDDTYLELQELAKSRNTTVLEILRRFIKLGLIATELENRKDAALIIREGDREREVILL